MKSIKNIFKIGQGPSSSHTVGPFNAAKYFKKRNNEADSYKVVLYGSLAFTGGGHGTMSAIKRVFVFVSNSISAFGNTLLIALIVPCPPPVKASEPYNTTL